MKKLSLLFLIIIINSSTIFASSYDNKDKIVNQFKKYLEYNSKSDSKEFLIVYSDKYQSSPEYLLEESDWFKEDIIGLTPYKDDICRNLNLYNNADFSDTQEPFTGNLQHYVIVVDVPIFISIEKSDYNVSVTEKDYYLQNEYKSKRANFKDQVKTSLSNLLSNGLDAQWAPSSKIWITIAFVQREIIDGNVKASVDFRYARAKKTSRRYYSKFEGYSAKGYNNLNVNQSKGLKAVYDDVRFFIKTFWQDDIGGMPCESLAVNVTSAVAVEFLEFYCGLIDTTHEEKKSVLLETSKFIDLLFAHSTGNANSVLKGEFHISSYSDIKDHWSDPTNNQTFFYFLADYFFESNPPKFHDWLTDYYLNQMNGVADNDYVREYLLKFINISCPLSSSEAVSVIRSTMLYYSLEKDAVFPPIRFYTNYSTNVRFYNVLKCVNENLDETNKTSIKLHILDPDNRDIYSEILFNEILDPAQPEIPGIGPASTSIAYELSKLMFSGENFNPLYPPDITFENTIVEDIGGNVLPETVTGGYGGPLGGIVSFYISQGYDVTMTNSNIKFDMKFCSNISSGLLSEIINNDCTFFDNGSILVKNHDFFDLVYSVVVTEPGYFDGCTDSYGNPTYNKVGYEHAFVTATKIRQDVHTHFVNDVTAVITLVSLPFTASELATAKGISFLLHGLYVANDLATVYIFLNPDGFKDDCKVMFGAAKGEEYANNIVSLTALIGGVQLGNIGVSLVAKQIGAGKSINTLFSLLPEEQISLIAKCRYAKEFESATSVVLVDEKFAVTTAAMEKTLKSKATAVESAILQEQRVYYGVTRNIDILSPEFDKLRNLIHKYRAKQVKFNETFPATDDLLETFLDGLPQSKFDDFISDINNSVAGDGLITYFTKGTDQVENAKRLKTWKALDDLGVDQAIRRNVTHLENVDGYFAKYPNRTSADLATTANQFDNVEDYLNVLPDITQNSLVKGARFSHFSDPAITNYNGNFSHAEYSFSLWKNNKWDELEDFFTANNLNERWPPNEGFKNVVNSETGTQLVGKKFDRFQGPGDISGGFASPVYSGEDIGDLFFTYDSRALKYDIAEGTQYILFEVKSSVPSGLKFDYGEVTPWFGKQGLGDQVKSSMRLEDVKDHLEIIDTKTYINGQWQ